MLLAPLYLPHKLYLPHCCHRLHKHTTQPHSCRATQPRAVARFSVPAVHARTVKPRIFYHAWRCGAATSGARNVAGTRLRRQKTGAAQTVPLERAVLCALPLRKRTYLAPFAATPLTTKAACARTLRRCTAPGLRAFLVGLSCGSHALDACKLKT